VAQGRFDGALNADGTELVGKLSLDEDVFPGGRLEALERDAQS
jgi:hypothetical protein